MNFSQAMQKNVPKKYNSILQYMTPLNATYFKKLNTLKSYIENSFSLLIWEFMWPM